MKKYLKAISANYPLEYYTNGRVIRNTDMVNATIEYFTAGPRSNVFEPLEFLNLLWRQCTFIDQNIDDTDKIVKTLSALPLSDLERHILFGFIIKWFGGYPLEAPSGRGKSQLYYNARQHILERFVAYPTETPEKEYCKVDFEKRERSMNASLIVSTAINYGTDPGELLEAMPELVPKESCYLTFDELFEEAVQNGVFGQIPNQGRYLAHKTACNFKFNSWLLKTKGWEYGNIAQYSHFLTKDIFLQFLLYFREADAQERKSKAKENESWKISSETNDNMDEVIKFLGERHRLSDFLSVPAPDNIIKDAFWHDEDGNPLEDPKAIQEYTDRGGKIVKVDWVQTHQKRLAEAESDFEIIYRREFTAKNLDDTPQTRKVFNNELVNYVQDLVSLHKARSTYEDGLDIGLLALADRFLVYLKGDTHDAIRSIDAPVFALFCSIVHQCQILVMEFDESKESFCSKVQQHFKIHAKSEQARKTFNRIMDIRSTDKRIEKIKELILPFIPTEEKAAIEAWLNNNTKYYG